MATRANLNLRLRLRALKASIRLGNLNDVQIHMRALKILATAYHSDLDALLLTTQPDAFSRAKEYNRLLH